MAADDTDRRDRDRLASQAIMTLDLVAKILGSASDPGRLSLYLTRQMRELTGARTVVLLEDRQDPAGERYRVVSVSPERRSDLAGSEEVRKLADRVRESSRSRLWNAPEDPGDAEATKILSSAGLGPTLAVPLRVGENVVGAMLLLDLPDLVNIDAIIEAIDLLSIIAALILRNALLFEQQERLIEVRTRALAESERKYRLLVENQNDLVVQLNADNLLQFTSPNCCTTFGKTEEELLGKDFTHLVHEEDRPTVVSSLEDLRRPPHTSEHQERMPTVHGWRWFAWVAKGMPNEAGELESVISVGRDVTEHRKAEEEIRRLNKELEQRVATRTSELLGAVRELEGLDYMVSHDLRAPVLHVGAFAELLLESHSGVLDDKGRYHLEAIRDSAGKMYELVENLLEFSRLGRVAIQRSRVDMSRLVHEVWSALAADRDTSRASLEVRPLPPATGDSDLLKLVWRNLLDNALKFSMLCDAPSITIDSFTADGRTWYRVADNGVGFDPQYADKLFGVFQRLHHEDEYPGTGVGLAIVERIVRSHGGQVRGHGAVGEGATFEFMLGQE